MSSDNEEKFEEKFNNALAGATIYIFGIGALLILFVYAIFQGWI